ncbi:tripartite tricarboxylate transporter substrate-binding protein [uncultured Tepidimonas sp.]|uniref:Bug family tripartite tricarboxylate transporter substrate binding protein n=1 Tax=uncultured Tepidimonas sp. TaxID=453579 RepID=UPI00260C1D73|nr:tripartite tricarboxylate transporter substrate-binding protein [uncultured Tepidimonas sp.]
MQEAPIRLRRWLLRAAVSAAAGVWAVHGRANPIPPATAWPSRPLRLVVGFPPGSSADELARALQAPLADALGQPVDVDNHPGAAGAQAALTVARATDDHTVGLLPWVHLTVARDLNPAVGYDPLTDLQPVALVATAPLALCVAPRLELRAAAAVRAIQRAGVAWYYGSPGVGSPFHLGMELLKAAADWQVAHVPYPGNAQVVNALLQGDVQLALLPPSLALPHWRAGKLPVIGVTSAAPSALLPGVPPLARLGVAGFSFEHWYALAGPHALGPVQAAHLAQCVRQVLRQSVLQQRLRALGWVARGSTPAALARRVAAEYDRVHPLIERQRIRQP